MSDSLIDPISGEITPAAPRTVSFEGALVPQEAAPIVPYGSRTMGSVWAALAQAQAEIKPPARDKEAKITSRDRGSYSYRYAPLEAVLAAVTPPLAKHGLGKLQYPFRRGASWFLRTIIFHAESQEWVGCDYPLFSDGPQFAGMQRFQSAVTYARRNGLTLLCAISPVDDDDANVADATATPAQTTAQASAERPERALYRRIAADIDSCESIEMLDQFGAHAPGHQDDMARILAVPNSGPAAVRKLIERDDARRQMILSTDGKDGQGEMT